MRTDRGAMRTDRAGPGDRAMRAAERQAHVTDDSLNVLVSRASPRISEPVHEELPPARVEVTRKGRRSGKGGGLFGAAGLLGILAAQALVATRMAGLALALPVSAAVVAVSEAADRRGRGPAPEHTIESVKAEVAEIQERAYR